MRKQHDREELLVDSEPLASQRAHLHGDGDADDGEETDGLPVVSVAKLRRRPEATASSNAWQAPTRGFAESSPSNVPDKYTLGAPNSDRCPRGYETITSEREAQQAAAAFGVGFAGVVCQKNRPRGCYEWVSGDLYLNTSAVTSSSGVAGRAVWKRVEHQVADAFDRSPMGIGQAKEVSEEPSPIALPIEFNAPLLAKIKGLVPEVMSPDLVKKCADNLDDSENLLLRLPARKPPRSENSTGASSSSGLTGAQSGPVVIATSLTIDQNRNIVKKEPGWDQAWEEGADPPSAMDVMGSMLGTDRRKARASGLGYSNRGRPPPRGPQGFDTQAFGVGPPGADFEGFGPQGPMWSEPSYDDFDDFALWSSSEVPGLWKGDEHSSVPKSATLPEPAAAAQARTPLANQGSVEAQGAARVKDSPNEPAPLRSRPGLQRRLWELPVAGGDASQDVSRRPEAPPGLIGLDTPGAAGAPKSLSKQGALAAMAAAAGGSGGAAVAALLERTGSSGAAGVLPIEARPLRKTKCEEPIFVDVQVHFGQGDSGWAPVLRI